MIGLRRMLRESERLPGDLTDSGGEAERGETSTGDDIPDEVGVAILWRKDESEEIDSGPEGGDGAGLLMGGKKNDAGSRRGGMEEPDTALRAGKLGVFGPESKTLLIDLDDREDVLGGPRLNRFSMVSNLSKIA